MSNNLSAEYILARSLPEQTNGLFSAASVEWLVRNRESNGLAPHMRKVNGKIYLNFPAFMDWFESQQA